MRASSTHVTTLIRASSQHHHHLHHHHQHCAAPPPLHLSRVYFPHHTIRKLTFDSIVAIAAATLTNGNHRNDSPVSANHTHRIVTPEHLANNEWDSVATDLRLQHYQTTANIALIPIHANSSRSIPRIRSLLTTNPTPSLLCVDLSRRLLDLCAKDAASLITITRTELRAIAGDQIGRLLKHYERTGGTIPTHINLLLDEDGNPVRVCIDHRLLSRTSLPSVTSTDNDPNTRFKSVRTISSSSPSMYAQYGSGIMAGDRYTTRILNSMGLGTSARSEPLSSGRQWDGNSSAMHHLLGFEYAFMFSQAAHQNILVSAVDANEQLLQVLDSAGKENLQKLVEYFGSALIIPRGVLAMLKGNKMSSDSRRSSQGRSSLFTRLIFAGILKLRTGIQRDIVEDMTSDSGTLRDYQYYVAAFERLFPIPSFFWLRLREANMVYRLRSHVQDVVQDMILRTMKNLSIRSQLEKLEGIKKRDDFEQELMKVVIEEDKKNGMSNTICFAVNKANVLGVVDLWKKSVEKEKFDIRDMYYKAKHLSSFSVHGDNIPHVAVSLEPKAQSGMLTSESKYDTSKLRMEILFENDSSFWGENPGPKMELAKLEVLNRAVDQLETVYTQLFLDGKINIEIGRRPVRFIPYIPQPLGIPSWHDVEDTPLSVKDSKSSSNDIRLQNKLELEEEMYLSQQVNLCATVDVTANDPNPNLAKAPINVQRRKQFEKKNRLVEIDC